MHRIVRLGVGHNMLELWHCPFESVKSPACQFANQTDITCSVYRSHRNACVASQLELDCSSWDAKEPPSLVQSKLPATGPHANCCVHCHKFICFPVKVCRCNMPWRAPAVRPALARTSTDLCAMIQRKPTADCLMASVGLNLMIKLKAACFAF